MPSRLFLVRLVLLATVFVIVLWAGYILLSRPAVIYPSIHPVEVQENVYRNVGMAFTFEGKPDTISIPVNGSVYLGAVTADKDAILNREIPDSEFLPAYYLAFVDDPSEGEFFGELSGAFTNLSAENGLDDDESLELVTVAVQSLPYETGGTLTSPKFPIETYVDGRGDCDDKSLLLAGLLAREGYSVALFSFEPEAHMAVGVKGTGCDYRGTGYGYVEATNLSFVGDPTVQLAGGVNLTSMPFVIPVANGSRLYGECAETRAIRDTMGVAKGRADDLAAGLATLSARMKDLRSRGMASEYNTLLGQYRAMVKEYNENAGIYDYILGHQDDRKGTFAWLRAQGLV